MTLPLPTPGNPPGRAQVLWFCRFQKVRERFGALGVVGAELVEGMGCRWGSTSQASVMPRGEIPRPRTTGPSLVQSSAGGCLAAV